MQSNPGWVAPLLWLGVIGATGGASYWGWREIEDYRESTGQELTERREAALSAQEESAARTRQLLAQLNPFFIVGTVAMTGIGTLIMVRGMSRERSRRQLELIQAYRGS